MTSSESFQQGDEVRFKGTHFWCEAPYLQKPMAQRVGAGLGRSDSLSKLGPTREPLGVGCTLNAALAASINYERMTSDDRWLLHSAEGRRPPKDPLERQPESRKLLPERMRQWAPQDRRLLHSTQSEAFRLGTLLSENYYKSAPSKPGLARRFRNPKILSAANAKADPLVRGKDELNYRTVPANVDDPSTSALLFPNRKGSTLRLHRNLSLPTTVVGELLTRDGQLVPIVPRAWKLAAAEKPKGTRPSTRSAGGFSISSLQASLVPDSPHQRASSGLLQVRMQSAEPVRLRRMAMADSCAEGGGWRVPDGEPSAAECRRVLPSAAECRRVLPSAAASTSCFAAAGAAIDRGRAPAEQPHDARREHARPRLRGRPGRGRVARDLAGCARLGRRAVASGLRVRRRRRRPSA